MSSTAAKIVDDEIAGYENNITKFSISRATELPPTPPKIEFNADYKINANEHTYEYIKKIIDQDFSTGEKLKFYFMGFLTGYNIGYTAALKDTTEELNEVSAEVERLELKIDQIISDVTELKVSDGKHQVGISNIEKILSEIKTSTDKISDINVTITKLEGRINTIDNKLNDKKETWRTWLPTIVMAGCSILAVFVTYWLGK